MVDFEIIRILYYEFSVSFVSAAHCRPTAALVGNGFLQIIRTKFFGA